MDDQSEKQVALVSPNIPIVLRQLIAHPFPQSWTDRPHFLARQLVVIDSQRHLVKQMKSPQLDAWDELMSRIPILFCYCTAKGVT